MLRIRLRRTGRKNRPNYRIVVAEHSAPLSGKFVDQLGHFDPRTKEMGVDTERLMKWLNVGAQPSNRVAKLLTQAKIDHKLIVVTTRKPRATRNPEPEAAPAAQPASEPAATEETPAAEPAATEAPVVEEPTAEVEPSTEAPAADETEPQA